MNTPGSRIVRLILAFAMACALMPALGYGQPYSLDRYIISCGGGPSADERYSITGTIGQYNATPALSVSGTYSEISGYWNPGGFLAGPIMVEDYLELMVGSTNVIGGQSASLPITLSSSAGVTSMAFTIQASDTIFSNFLIGATAPEIGSATLTDQGTSLLIAIQAKPGQTLHGTGQLAQLNFLAVRKPPSSFVSLTVTSICAVKPDASTYVNYIAQGGTVTVVQDAPLLRAVVGPDMQRSLMLFGLPGVNYQIQYTTNLTSPIIWTPLLNYSQANEVITITVAATNDILFYRLLVPNL